MNFEERAATYLESIRDHDTGSVRYDFKLASLASLLEEVAAEERREIRIAFDAGFTVGTAYGCGYASPEEAMAARELKRVPTVETCDKMWAIWQSGRARTPEPTEHRSLSRESPSPIDLDDVQHHEPR